MKKTRKKVVVAMSGGVDSAVVAALMQKEGHEVIGITLQLYEGKEAAGKSCCGITDIYDAKMICHSLDMPHYVLDYQKNFKKEIMTPFADDYLAGVTPVPCINCNKTVKFRDLVVFAKELNADFMATGHYVQKIINNGISELHAGADKKKDQSYFLYGITQDVLDFCLFPVGGMQKEEVKKLAQEYDLPIVTHKKESQDICFVPNGDYVAAIKKIRDFDIQIGDIVNVSNGQKLGTHKGLIYYTIGQRKGIGVSFNEPLYVVNRDFVNNVLFVGTEDDLYNDKFIISDINILDQDIEKYKNIEVCLRALQPLLPAKVKINGNNAEVSLLRKGRAITPGQSCVFYYNNRILGGGIIKAVIV